MCVSAAKNVDCEGVSVCSRQVRVTSNLTKANRLISLAKIHDDVWLVKFLLSVLSSCRQIWLSTEMDILLLS